MKVSLSVIIPIYNTPQYLLEHCLTSIQDNIMEMKDVEVLMINDGSTEPYIAPLLKEKALSDSRFQYIEKSNSGVSNTRNMGIELSQGEYITFVDADDYLEPDALPYMLQTAICADVDMVMFGFCRNDFDLKERKLIKQRFEVNEEILQTLISNNMERWLSCGTNLASVWAKVYRREKLLLHQISFIPDLITNEDGFFNLCLISKIPAFYIDNTLLYHYVINEGSAIHRFTNCDIRIGKSLLPRLEVFVKNNNLNEIDYSTSIGYRTLKLIMSAKRLYFTHPQNTKSFWELKTELNDFLSEPIIKKWIKKYRLKDVRNKEELKNLVLLKLHLYFIFLIRNQMKRKKIKNLSMCLSMKQSFLKLLFVSGLLRKDSSRKKIRLRKRAYIYVLIFPVFILLLMRAFLIIWKSRLYNSKRRIFKHNLAIVVIAKNESEYISEWLAYHKLQGVEKVFLYDNDSTDNMRDILKPYIADGFVEYNEIHGRYKQFEAYTNAINRYGHLTKYMAFIDCDEFMMPVDSDNSLLKIVDNAFAKDINAGGLVINWCIYGSSGYEAKPVNGLVMENYTHHSHINHDWNYTIKSIVKPYCVKGFSHPHYPEYRPGFYGINFQGEIIPFWWNAISEYVGIRLNHYYCKSKEEYVKRITLGRVDVPGIKPMDNFYINDRNEENDEVMLVYCHDVKKIMSVYQK